MKNAQQVADGLVKVIQTKLEEMRKQSPEVSSGLTMGWRSAHFGSPGGVRMLWQLVGVSWAEVEIHILWYSHSSLPELFNLTLGIEPFTPEDWIIFRDTLHRADFGFEDRYYDAKFVEDGTLCWATSKFNRPQ